MSGSKMGRPTDDPKTVVIRCRVTKDFNDKLEEFCTKNQTTKSNIIVESISEKIGYKKEK